MSGGLQVLQSTVGNGLSFDPLSFGQDRRAAPAIDVCRGEIVDALVVSAVVVLVDESRNLSSMSGFWGNSENIYSRRVLPSVTKVDVTSTAPTTTWRRPQS
jgi:hypothetical protein